MLTDSECVLGVDITYESIGKAFGLELGYDEETKIVRCATPPGLVPHLGA